MQRVLIGGGDRSDMAICASVAIPTYQRSAFVLNALQTILAQKTDFAYEVLILDNDCDSTIKVEVEHMASSVSIPVIYVPVPELGLHNGRHSGARHAKGQILVFVDDDIIADRNWLQAIVDTFHDPDVHLVGGRNLPLYEEEPPAWLEALWTQNPDGTRWCGYLSLLDFGEQYREIDPGFVWGVNFAIRKKSLVDLGGFHPDGVPWELRRFRGDGESAVSREAEKRGLKAIYQPKALIYHRVPKSRMTIEYFERRAYLQGISDSFTMIRSNGGLMLPQVSSHRFDWKAPLRRAKRLARRLLKPEQPQPLEPYQEIKARIRAAYQAGFEYHQNEIRNDPRLLEWVLKPDYWVGHISQFANPASTGGKK
jgi:glycosyltransferase involved in cell wall biosynthesis